MIITKRAELLDRAILTMAHW